MSFATSSNSEFGRWGSRDESACYEPMFVLDRVIQELLVLSKASWLVCRMLVVTFFALGSN